MAFPVVNKFYACYIGRSEVRVTRIRTATMDDLEMIAAVEAECFPAAEAATKEEFAKRLQHYSDHFWLMFGGETDCFCGWICYG